MILVTGATGTNGSEIVKQLCATGAKVRALVRNSVKAEVIAQPGVEIIEGDFSKPETLKAALQGVEKAIFLPPFDPRMVEWQSSFIEAAKHAGIKHIVKFSVLGANPNSPVSLLKWHGQGEKQLEESGISFTHLRPNGFMQNFLALAPTISTQGVFYQPADDAKISHVDVRDIVAVAVKSLTEDGHENKVYTITGPQALSFDEIALQLTALTGKQVKYINVSPEDFKRSLLGFKQPEWLADAVNELFEFYRSGYGSIVTDVVAEVTNKQPVSFDQFTKDYAQVFMGN